MRGEVSRGGVSRGEGMWYLWKEMSVSRGEAMLGLREN